jgi:hypothetical protein
MVASGIAGREGDLVDRVRLICHWLDRDQQRSGRAALTRATGGLGGHLAIVSCPRAGYATGFVGHIRTVGIPIIDFVRLRCVG